MKRTLVPTLAIFALLALAGCATTGGTLVLDRPAYQPPSIQPTPVADSNGGFTYGSGSLYSGRRARVVGDLVTIRVIHATQAGTSATTSLKRNGTMGAGVTAMFGLETELAKLPGGGPSLDITTSTTNDYEGEGGTDRAGSLTGTLTTRVIEVLPNGHLVLFGSQDVRVNDESEVLAVTGVVDPRDIGTDNSVLSTRVAELRMEYAGIGVVAGKQRPGWFTRIFDVVTPF
jgi:flagellar L-ring protein FlgH